MTLFLPPLAGRQRTAPLHRPRQRQRRPAYLDEAPPWLDPHVDVDAARPAGLRPRYKAKLIKKSLYLHGHRAYIGPYHAGLRIKVYA
jgi:hypothetical protein